MKVNIGPYKNWVGPYQIAEKIFFWVNKYEDDEADGRVHRFGEWLATNKNGDDSWLTKLCRWIDSHKPKRKVKVKVDYYDTWSLDHTIALIAAPALVQLRDTMHGFGLVDDEDVPEHIRSTNAPPHVEWEWDDLAEARWNWVIGEMIWAMQEHCKDDGDSQFYDHSGVNDKADINEQIKQLKVDREGLKAYQDRKSNGFRLFGKYFQNLWD